MSSSILLSPLVGLVEVVFVHLFFLAARQDVTMRWFGKETKRSERNWRVPSWKCSVTAGTGEGCAC